MNSIPDSYSLKQGFPEGLGEYVDPSGNPNSQVRIGYGQDSVSRFQQPVPDVDPTAVNHYNAGAPIEVASPFDNVTQGLVGSDAQALAEYWQKTIDTLEHDDQAVKTLHLPLARIKKVMKTDDDVKNKMISAEAPFLFAKGSEIFIAELTMRAWLHAKKNQRRTLQRSDIANAVSKSEMYDFLIDIISKDNNNSRASSSQAHMSATQVAAMGGMNGLQPFPTQAGLPNQGFPMPTGSQLPFSNQQSSQPSMQYSSHPSRMQQMQDIDQSMYKQQRLGSEYPQLQMSDNSGNVNQMNMQRPVMVAPYMAEHLYRYPPTHLESGSSAFRLQSSPMGYQMPQFQGNMRPNMQQSQMFDPSAYGMSRRPGSPRQFDQQQRLYSQPNAMMYQTQQGRQGNPMHQQFSQQQNPLSRYSQQPQ
ncbi:Transcriptional activator hap5 [Schizosaccharomyces pombe]